MHSACHKINALIIGGVHSEGGNSRCLRGPVWAKGPAAVWTKWVKSPDGAATPCWPRRRKFTSCREWSFDMNCKRCRQQANAWARANARRPAATPSIALINQIEYIRARLRSIYAGVMYRIAESRSAAEIDDAGNRFAQMRQGLLAFTARDARVLNANRPWDRSMFRLHSASFPGLTFLRSKGCCTKAGRTGERQITEKVCLPSELTCVPLAPNCRITVSAWL
jgi:hypothetical protein